METSELKNREQEIRDCKQDLRILQIKYKTSVDTISGLIEYHKDLRTNFKQGIAKLQEETNMQINNKDNELTCMEGSVENLNKDLESLQLRLDKEIAERQRLDGELCKLNDESKIWTSEKSALERQILEYKTKFNTSASHIKALQNLIAIQDIYLEGFKDTILTMENEEKRLLNDIKIKQNENEKVRNDLCEAKKMLNKEKLMHLSVKNRCTIMECVHENFKSELKSLTDMVHKRNVENDLQKNQLDELNSDLRDEYTAFFTLQIESEKATEELCRVKAEITETITKKQILKETNVRLTAQLEAMIEDSNVMQNVIYKYENGMMEQKVCYEERLIKADATILQQKKLIDFLQTKYNEVTKDKRIRFSGKNKENIDQKEIEPLLNSERSKSKDVATKLYQTQAELNMIKRTPLAPTSLNFETNTPLNNLIDVNCVRQISQSVFLLGAVKGLFSVHIKTRHGQIKHDLVPIIGPKLVKDIVFLPELQLVLMIAGSTKEILKCNMKTVTLNSELSIMSKPDIKVVRIIDEIRQSQPSNSGFTMSELKEVNCISTSRCNEIVAVGSEDNITILIWQDTQFVVTKILKTHVSVKCIFFMPTGIIFTTDSFGIFEIENFSCKRFYTDAVAKSHDYRPMFVCELTKNKEYLLCFNMYAIFVDADGKKTQSGEMKWPYNPNSFTFKKPFLIIVSESEISIMKITQSCCIDEGTCSITSTKQPEDLVVLNINHPTLLGGSDLCLMDTNDFQNIRRILHLEPSKIIRNSVASSDTLDTLDTQGTCDKSEFSFTSSMLENLDEEQKPGENTKEV